MKNYNLSFLFVVSIFASATSSFADTNLDIISQNIENVCKKPADAGKYWDMKVSADGEARLRLILPKVGASGTATFTKGEWEGIQSTVEDNINYRDCVKIIAPIFIEKFDNFPWVNPRLCRGTPTV